jgi:alkylated DNA nucleotide flippase Atl1
MPRSKSATALLQRERSIKIVEMIPPGAPGFAEAEGGSMVVSTPAEVDAVIRLVGPGEVVTLDDMRRFLAARHGTTIACPVSTAIFINMAARAAEEQRAQFVDPATLTPWWRVLKRGGFLNPKLPGGVARQTELLEADGVRVSPLNRQSAVYDLEKLRPASFAEPLS